MVGVWTPAVLIGWWWSAENEHHSKPPQRWLPSMLYAKQFQPGGEYHAEAVKFSSKQ